MNAPVLIKWQGKLIDVRKSLIELDRYEAPRELVRFVQLAWHVVEPGQPYIHNWHIDHICLPGHVKLETREGPRSIKEIVESKWEGEVLSFNHTTGLPEWRRILNHMKNPGQPLFTITSNATSVSMTGNHPVFVDGIGYVPAALVKAGQNVIQLQTVRDRVQSIASEDRGRNILQSSLFRRLTGKNRKTHLLPLWREEINNCWKRVQKLLAENYNCWKRSFVPTLRYTSVVNTVETKSVLQQEMHWPWPIGVKESGVHRRESAAAIPFDIQVGERENKKTGWWGLLHLLVNKTIRRTSHRQESSQQRGMEPRCVMSGLSSSAGQEGKLFGTVKCNVSSVEPEIRIPEAVYNIEVEGNNNYFADGLLVHNCAHLEAITRGEMVDDERYYNRLLINVPPGAMKSLIVNVFWPAWEWGPRRMPSMRYVCASHSMDLAIRDSTKMRRLIQSEWYQERWGDVVTLTGDQNAKTKFENTKTGFRQAIAAGSITGARGDRVICFPAEQIVQTENGPMQIGDIVRDRKNVRVWSADPKVGKPELKKILDWKHNPASEIVEVVLSDGASIRCTPDHKIWTINGWKEAQYLSDKDVLPCAPLLDVQDALSANSVSSRNFRKRSSVVKNLTNLIFGQFGPTDRLTSSEVVAFNKAFSVVGPSFASPDLLDSSALDSVNLRKIFSSVTTRGNLYGLLFGQYGTGAVAPDWKCSMPLGIADVLSASAVFEVFKSTVSRIPVFVSNLVTKRRSADKSQHDSLMDKNLCRPSISVGIESRIALRARRFKDFLWNLEGSFAFARDNSFVALDASKIADAVEAIEPNYRFPVLVRNVGHVDETFCLTVEDHHTFYVGERNCILVSNCDDPHSVESAASEAMRASTRDWFEQALPTRLNNPDKSAIVVIMQRLHEEDVSGIILEKQADEYDHIMIPMEYDPDRASVTKLGWEDPRTERGELYFPERFPRHVVDRDKKIMGTYAVSGQFQQTPTPDDGGIIKKSWWQLWDQDAFPAFDFIVASIDTAYTEKTENDYSAMSVWGIYTEDPVAQATRDLDRHGRTFAFQREYKQPHPKVMMIYAWQERLQFSDLITKIVQTCERFSIDRVLIEDKAVGIPIASELRRVYANKNFGVQLEPVGTLDKAARLYSIQHLFEEGLVYAPDKAWADEVIMQCVRFPKAKHDDLVDTVSMSMRYLRRTGLIQRVAEVQEQFEISSQHTGAPPAPLYGI
jgi:predicted phage terminase large subunit-like protein